MLFLFPYIVNLILPTDELIFFRGVGCPHQSGFNDVNIKVLGISRDHEYPNIFMVFYTKRSKDSVNM